MVEFSISNRGENGSSTLIEAESNKRLIGIFEREIEREVAEKMVAVTEISKNIRKCQQDLDRLRKEAITKFYMGSNLKEESVEQQSIHPAVKKLIGKRPLSTSATEQFMKNNMTEWYRETRKKRCLLNHFHKNKRRSKITKTCVHDSYTDNQVKPCYVPPVIPGNPQENASIRGNIKKMHMRVLVGNVAKQVESEDKSSATHKWMIYVRSAPGSLSLEEQVTKVCFYLHPSYKPHHVITVLSPPFTLNRRGWGEFPLRVQLFFKNPLNKTADIIHNLKFNGARSGFHTRSAETFADLWVYPYQDIRHPQTSGENNSKEILWLASNMLKEEVPDFTTEVMCHKCLITSTSSEVYKCTCYQETQLEELNEIIVDQTQADSDLSDSESSSDESEIDLKYLGSLDPLEYARNQQQENLTNQNLISLNTTPETHENKESNPKYNEELYFCSSSQHTINTTEELLTNQLFCSTKDSAESNTNQESETSKVKTESDSSLCLQNSIELPEKKFTIQSVSPLKAVTESNKKQEIKTKVTTECDFTSNPHAKNVPESTFVTSNLISKNNEYHETKATVDVDSSLYLQYSRKISEDTLITPNIILDSNQVTKSKLNTKIDSGSSNLNGSAVSHIKIELNDQTQPKLAAIPTISNNWTNGNLEAVKIEPEAKNDGINNDIFLANQFLANQSDLMDLNVEPSDLFADLEIKEELLEEIQKDISKGLAEETLLFDLVSENFIDWCSENSSVNSKNKEDTNQQINNDTKDHLETKLGSNFENSDHNLIVNDSKSETNTFLACQTIAQRNDSIEEIPINMFIDNIIEEVIVDNESISSIETDNTSYLEKPKCVSCVVAYECNDSNPSPSSEKVDLQMNNDTTFNNLNCTNPSQDFQKCNFDIIKKEVIVDESFNTVSVNDTSNVTENKGIRNFVVATKSNNLVTSPDLSKFDIQSNNSKFMTLSSTIPSKNLQRINLPLQTKEPRNTNKSEIAVNNCNENRKVELITYKNSVKSLLSMKSSTSLPVQSFVKKDLNNCVLTTSNYNSKSILVTSKRSQSLLKPKGKNPNSLLKSNHTQLTNNHSPVQIPGLSKSLVQEPNLAQNVIVKPVITPGLKANTCRNVSPSGQHSSVKSISSYLQNSNVKPSVQNSKYSKTLSIISKHSPSRLQIPRPQNSITRCDPLDTLSPSPKLNKLGLQSANVKVVSTLRHVGQIIRPKLQVKSISLQHSVVSSANSNTQSCNVRYDAAPVSRAANPRSLMIKSTLSPSTTKMCVSQQQAIVQNHSCPSNQTTFSIQKAKNVNAGEQNDKSSLLTNGSVNNNSKDVTNKSSVFNQANSQKYTNGLSLLKKTTLKPPVEKLSSREQFKTVTLTVPLCREPNLGYEEILSIHELRKVLRLPELNIPPDIEEYKTGYKHVLTCNSLHNDVKQAVPLFSDCNKKCVISNKDYMISLANEQYLFYLHQLSWLVNSCKFSEPELAVRWLIRGMPLVHSDARLMSFKALHPYCAVSADLYRSWPRAKQVANEWLRAKTIEKFMKVLRAKGVSLKSIWTTSTIYRWSQANGYSPAISPSGTDSVFSDDENIVTMLSKKTHPNDVMEWMDSVVRKPQSEELVDIVCEDIQGKLGDTAVRLSPTPVDCDQEVICGKPWVRDMSRYIRSQLNAMNYRLALEQLAPDDTLQPLAATLLSHLAMCFTEDLTRRALAVCNTRKGSSVLPCDVNEAILQRPEFDLFTQKGLQIDSKVHDFLNKYKSSQG